MWIYYKNGNYNVLLNKKNGTKIRYNNLNFFQPERPESIDVKITNQCNYGCLFCHEGSVPSGEQATYGTLKDFAQSLEPYTEIAVGGGSLMVDWRHTEFFLKELKKANAIPSITVYQNDFVKYSDIIEDWYINNLIYGVGVSVSNPFDLELQKTLQYIPTAVLHVIAGIFNKKDFYALRNKGYKILILGFKQFRRGLKFYSSHKQDIDKNIKWLTDNFDEIKQSFKVIAFDNLAIEQLMLQDKFFKEEWNHIYMGDDGQFTFYVDLVKHVFSKNSRSLEVFPITDFNSTKMFQIIKENCNDTD